MIEEVPAAIPSGTLRWLCVGISVVLAAAFPAGRYLAGRRLQESDEELRRGTLFASLGVLAWMALTGALAGARVLDDFSSFPPRVMPVLGGGVILVIAVTASPLGRRLALGLPLSILVGYQVFRVAVEIMLHRAGVEGVIGMQMTWSGLNFDVLTGLTGFGLGLWLHKRDERSAEPKALLWIWNVIGLGLLITIVSIAIMSMPGPTRHFDGPPNTWVATLPFVWLPTMMVMAALLGHLLLARRLLSSRS